MEKKLKFKIITGFRENQFYTIEADEVHKAYYLFLHPEERSIFSNGVALIGKNIQGIEPDYNASMGWNPAHKLDPYDWEEIRSTSTDRKLQQALNQAKEVCYLAESNKSLLLKPLSEAVLQLNG